MCRGVHRRFSRLSNKATCSERLGSMDIAFLRWEIRPGASNDSINCGRDPALQEMESVAASSGIPEDTRLCL